MLLKYAVLFGGGEVNEYYIFRKITKIIKLYNRTEFNEIVVIIY